MVSDVPGVTKKEYKIAPGTKNMTREAAMTRTEAIRAILTGIEIVGMLKSKSYEILATGENGDRKYDDEQCGCIGIDGYSGKINDRKGSGT